MCEGREEGMGGRLGGQCMADGSAYLMRHEQKRKDEYYWIQ